MKKLTPTLGLFSATMLAISIVVGAGMLVLPGLVYTNVGPGAYWSWIGDTLVAVPLLWVFVKLGKLHPSAGGVSGFVAAAWPKARLGVSLVLLGTFALGIPAIALTGGQYLLEGVGIPATPVYASMAALALLSVASTIVFFGAKLASGWQNFVMIALLGVLAFIAVATIPNWKNVPISIPTSNAPVVWKGMALAFFSYTGWEMFASIAEDMKNPVRDFPRAVVVSFVLISALYLGAALAIESTVAIGDPSLAKAPFVPVVAKILGDVALAKRVLGAVVVVIIFSNLVGAVLAASRLVFDLGRTTELGSKLGLDLVDPETSSPRRAVGFALGIFALVLFAHGLGAMTISDLLGLAGQNFFVLYTVCVVVFLKLVKDRAQRGIALAALVFLFLFGSVFRVGLIYPAVLFALPYVTSSYLRRTPSPRPSSPRA